MPVLQHERAEKSEKLVSRLQDKLGAYILSSQVELGDAVVIIAPPSVPEFFRLLKLDSELSFDMFINITAIDWMDDREDRFEVVYHLLNTKSLDRLRVKIGVPESDPKIATVSELWAAANFMEREVYDMYGIQFANHPDLRRILMYDEFVGHPLRKDYPVQGKQPRVQLRSPEVENTARQMRRDPLVQIGKGAVAP